MANQCSPATFAYSFAPAIFADYKGLTIPFPMFSPGRSYFFGFLLSAMLGFISIAAHAQRGELKAENLLCNNQTKPMGVGQTLPFFSWQVISPSNDIQQTAYELQVEKKGSGTVEPNTIHWQTGKVSSGQSIMLSYSGPPLQSASHYRWRVKIWDNKGAASGYSNWSEFSTGLLKASDWGAAQWIGYEALPDSLRLVPGVIYNTKGLGGKAQKAAVIPYLRQKFYCEKQLVQATAYVTGIGHYEMSINGRKVGNSLLTPGWTHYDKRVLYNVYDVTSYIQQGRNAIGMLIGNGFHYQHKERYVKLLIAYGYPRAICQIRLTYIDGSEVTINSGSDWKTSRSPITFSSMYGGEDYDARLQQPGWDHPQFDDSQWQAAAVVPAPSGPLEAESDFPVAVRQVLEPRKIVKLTPRRHVYDFGQNASGIFQLIVSGKPGQTIRLYAGETLDEQGKVNQRATGRPSYFTYTLKGDGVETWQPNFTYTGFRYIQAEPVDTTDGVLPQVEQLHMLHTGNTTPVAGSFSCSNPLFNQIYTLINWAINSNLQSVSTDCPHREKLGWLEQTYLMGSSLHYNRNLHLLYRKMINDMLDAQTETGLVPAIVPEFVYFDFYDFNFRDSPEWGSASLQLPWLLYKWYGDSSMLRIAYPMMQRYQQHLTNRSTNHIVTHGLGDWYDLGPNSPGMSQLTPAGVTATATYYANFVLLEKIATLLGKAKEAQTYHQQTLQVKDAFNKKYFNDTTNLYANGSQTSLAMPLVLGMVPVGRHNEVLKNLTDSIRSNGYQLTAGDVGYYYLVKALHDGGHSDILFAMNNRDDVPGYGYQLKKGATSLTESWAALSSVSNNHFMLGHIMDWFYKGISGISQHENSTGYKHIVIAPQVVGDLKWAKSQFNIPYGTINTRWKIEGNQLLLDVEIPANTIATIIPPNKKNKSTGEMESSAQEIKVGSGKHNFSFRWE